MVEAVRRYGAVEFEQLDSHLSSGLDAPLILEFCERGNRWCRMGIHPVESGGVVLTGSDVTDQHQAHEIIEHADDQLKDILDACASRIALSRISDGRLLYRTPAWKADFGEIQYIQESFRRSSIQQIDSKSRVEKEVDLALLIASLNSPIIKSFFCVSLKCGFPFKIIF